MIYFGVHWSDWVYAARYRGLAMSRRREPGFSPSTIRILIADDFAPWRRRLRTLLREPPHWAIVFEACDGVEAVEKAMELCPDVILLDIGMPGLNGIDAGRLIRTKCPGSIVLFVTQNHDPEIRAAAIESSGAKAYLLKTEAAAQLVPAITDALNGRASGEPSPVLLPPSDESVIPS